MQSRMHPKYYLSQEIFEREQTKIFRKVWLFAGLKTLLPQHNSFITRKVAGTPVVIQNAHGKLHAFENICLHRSAPLQTEPVGCRPLVCPYHAWKYDATGHVSNIPHCDAIYLFDEAEKQSLKLREFALRTVGNLLFINLDPQPLPLEEQFSPQFLASLESSSLAYDTEVMVTTWHCKFNWKLVYENLRDFNHVRFLHPKSFGNYVDFVSTIDQSQSSESQLPLTDNTPEGLRKEMRRFSYGGRDAMIPDMRRAPWHSSVERWGDQDAYYNWLSIPNLHIASGNGGHSFTIEHHIPIAPDKTDLELYWITARKKQPIASSHQVLLANMHGSKQIVGEDVDMLEKIQTGLHLNAPIPNQGAYESTNRLIERWYTTLMETEHEL